MRRILFYLLFISIGAAVQGQQRLPSNRTNTFAGIGDDLGNNMAQEDRTRMKQDSTMTEVTDIPVDLHQWTLSSRFGDIHPTAVDTMWHQYMNAHLNEGMTGEFNHLGNFGSPRESRIYFEREPHSNLFFTEPYSFFYHKPDQFHFTNTKSPFTNLTYYSAGDKLNGDDHFKAYFAVNANKRTGFGFLADYVYGRGQYNSQSTSLFSASLYAYHHGEHYQANFLASKYHMKMAENGGITDDRYITDPMEMAEGERTYDPENIPTRMERAWNRNDNWNIYFNHRYRVGFYRSEELAEDDTTTIPEKTFIPVTSFIHTVQVTTNDRKFISRDEPANYYLYNYPLSGNTDRARFLSVKNTFGIALLEGFNKWAQAGLTAYITHEYRQFRLPDTLIYEPAEYTHKYSENIVSIGGKLTRRQGHTLHYDLLGETVVAGEDLGQFLIEGNGDLNFRLFKDTVRIDINAHIRNQAPSFYFRHYHSRHFWWDNNDLDKIFSTRIEGGITIERSRTHLRAGVENIKNYTYFANSSQAVPNSNSRPTSYRNNVHVAQCSDNIQVFTARLSQDFKSGIFHLDNEVTYQKSSNNTVLPLPELSLYHNFYLSFKLAKVLSMELGADLRYFSKYYASDYAPALGQFIQQNQQDKVEIGGYPFVNVYLNAHLKRTRFYIMMYHINEGTGDSNYFLAPHYPINPRTLQLGLSWNFFD